MSTIQDRLTALRSVMRRERLAAFIFPSTDPHQGEYVAERWKGREYVSGFNGSAGTAVVTMKHAALWTDSRYFIAAESQLSGTEYQLMRLKMPGTPTVAEWTAATVLAEGASTEIGIDGMVWAEADCRALVAELRSAGGVTVRTNLDILNNVWAARPAVPLSPITIQPIDYAGRPAREKLADVRAALRRSHADGMLVARLDDVAWTLNIRATDVHCTPLAVGFLLITTETATLFTPREKVAKDIEAYLGKEGVTVADYKDVAEALSRYPDYTLLLDPSEVSATLFKCPRCHVVEAASPIPAMKAVKNAAEIRSYHAAMRRDGVALVRFMRWLKEGARRQIESGGEGEPLIIDGQVQTEMSIDRRLTALRAEQELYRDLSFDTIAGYAEHGAIVHYEATEATDARLCCRGLLLLDSGAQYQDGTTDITRTIPLGPLTDEQRLVYTLVLKGNISLARAVFPEGTCGTQLDVLARQHIWRHGYNYLHGTGHGVGSYLSVHEGPHQIRMEHMGAPLRAGMTVTDEPGVYLEGRFGVRIENTLLIIEHRDTEHSPSHQTMLTFEPLTLCPIDMEPVILDMLTADERLWLNAYHCRVLTELSPLLADEADRMWLAEACREV